MAEVAQAYVSLMFSAKGATDQITKEVAGASTKAGSEGGKRAGKAFHAGMIPGVAKIGAALGGAFAATKVVSFFKDSIAEARESQKVGAITANVIKSTGGAANVTAKQVGNLATAISNKTGIDDEAVQSASNLLLTFTNVRNEAGKGNKVFDQATQAATDMAAAMGKPPKAAAIQLGKALNDPVKGLTALSKVGVSFDKGQQAQIKHMVAHGKTLGAQKIILGELRKEFGGTAAASATSGEKMATAFANFKEQIGTALLPYIDKLENLLTNKVIPAVSKFITGFQNGTGPGGQLANVVHRVSDAFKAALPYIAAVLGWLVKNKTTVVAFAGTALLVVAAYRAWTKATAALAIVQAVLNGEMEANPIGLVVVAIAALVAGLVYAYRHSEKFRNVVDQTWGVLKVVGAFIAHAFVGYLTLLAKAWLTVGIFGVKALRMLLTAAFKVFGGIVHAAAAGLGWIPGIGPKVKKAAGAFDSFGKSVVGKLLGVENKLRDVRNGIDQIKPKTVHIDIITTRTERIITKNQAAAKHADIAGTRAAGGPVRRGGLYLVGEDGPELFRPKASGQIVPNVQRSYANVQPAAAGETLTGRRVALVVGDRTFDAYLAEVADTRIRANRHHAATMGRQHR